jgi:hypothetical protein
MRTLSKTSSLAAIASATVSIATLPGSFITKAFIVGYLSETHLSFGKTTVNEGQAFRRAPNVMRNRRRALSSGKPSWLAAFLKHACHLAKRMQTKGTPSGAP